MGRSTPISLCAARLATPPVGFDRCIGPGRPWSQGFLIGPAVECLSRRRDNL